MTKKQYVQIAQMFRTAVKTSKTDGELALVQDMITEFIKIAKADNDRFSEDRFCIAIFAKK